MKKILLLFLLLLPIFSFAQMIQPPITATSIEALIEEIVKIITWFTVAIAPVVALIGAIFILTSGGDPQKVNKGKNTILYTAVALFIVFLARGLIGLVKMILEK